MAKPIILITSPESAGELEALQKAHVSSYTRKDGTFVAEHDDKRVAKPKAGGEGKHPHEDRVAAGLKAGYGEATYHNQKTGGRHVIKHYDEKDIYRSGMMVSKTLSGLLHLIDKKAK